MASSVTIFAVILAWNIFPRKLVVYTASKDFKRHCRLLSFLLHCISTFNCHSVTIYCSENIVNVFCIRWWMLRTMNGDEDAGGRFANDRPAEPTPSSSHRSAHAWTVANRQPQHLETCFVSHFYYEFIIHEGVKPAQNMKMTLTPFPSVFFSIGSPASFLFSPSSFPSFTLSPFPVF